MKRRVIQRRVVVVLLLLLAGGAIVNVAVAWGLALCAGRLPYRSIDYLSQPEVEEFRSKYDSLPMFPVPRNDWPTDWPVIQLTGVPRKTYIGVTVVASSLTSTSVQNQKVVRQEDRSVSEIQAGFPVRCFLGAGGIHRLNGKSEVVNVNAIDLNGNGDTLIPIAPTWPGFAINTIFYAAILWVVFYAPGKLKQTLRRRRGQCPACAYPIGTSDVCTECGAAL